MWQPAGCPRCRTPVGESDGVWSCSLHGKVPRVWRPVEPGYDVFAEHLVATAGFPTYLPWPLSPGWRISDFSSARWAGSVVGTMCCASGTSEADGPVDLLVVAEEPGTGLGGRCAGIPSADPGPDVGRGAPAVRLRVEGRPVPLWAVSTSAADTAFDRAVFVGEAFGRWLWLVLRPPSAMLLLREEWSLVDVSTLGPPLVEVPFGGPGPGW